MMHIFTESVLTSENIVKIDARELQRRAREDGKRFQEDNAHEWYSPRTIRRTWLLALLASGATFAIVYCIRFLP